MVVQLGSHLPSEAVTHIVIVHITVDYGGISCSYDTEEARILVP